MSTGENILEICTGIWIWIGYKNFLQSDIPSESHPIALVYCHKNWWQFCTLYIYIVIHTVEYETIRIIDRTISEYSYWLAVVMYRPAVALNVWSTSGPLLLIAADLTVQSLESSTDCSQPHSPYRSKSQLYVFLPAIQTTATAITASQQTSKTSFVIAWYAKIMNKQLLWKFRLIHDTVQSNTTSVEWITQHSSTLTSRNDFAASSNTD